MADHSLPIRDALHAACKPLVKAIEAPDVVQTQAAVASTQDDLLATMRETARLLIQVESVAKEMQEASTRLRSALLDSFLESGAPGVEIEFHSVGYADGAPGVIITGEVPAEFMRRPEPAPDRAAIAKAMRAGRQVPGAVLKNAAPHLVVRAKKG